MMKTKECVKHLRFGLEFSVVLGNARSQAATMVLERGGTEGGPDNRHRGSDQWIYVVSGTGRAIVAGKTHELRAGSLLLIERGQTHEIQNRGRSRLKAVNFYVPPAYTAEGNELPAGKA